MDNRGYLFILSSNLKVMIISQKQKEVTVLKLFIKNLIEYKIENNSNLSTESMENAILNILTFHKKLRNGLILEIAEGI